MVTTLVTDSQADSFPSSCPQIKGHVFILQFKCSLYTVSTQVTGVQTDILRYLDTHVTFSQTDMASLFQKGLNVSGTSVKCSWEVLPSLCLHPYPSQVIMGKGIRPTPSTQDGRDNVPHHKSISLSLNIFDTVWTWPGSFCHGLHESKGTNEARLLPTGFCCLNWNPHFSSSTGA